MEQIYKYQSLTTKFHQEKIIKLVFFATVISRVRTFYTYKKPTTEKYTLRIHDFHFKALRTEYPSSFCLSFETIDLFFPDFCLNVLAK